jgi:hypothetical protein
MHAESMVRSESGPPLRGQRSIALWCFAVFVFSLSIDYKSVNEGGDVIQVLCLTAAVGSALILGLVTKLRSRSNAGRSFARLSMLFLFISGVGTLINRVPLDRYVRVLVPYALCIIGFWICRTVLGVTGNLRRMVQVVVGASLVNGVWRFVYAVAVMKVPIDDLRYQIIGPGALVLCCWSCSHILHVRRITVFNLTCLIAGWLPAILSVTRGFLLALACGVAVIFLASVRREFRISGTVAFLKVQVLCVSAVCVVALGAVLISGTDIAYKWTARMDGVLSGDVRDDATFLTRKAEMDGLLGGMGSPIPWVVGNGLGSSYRWGQAYDAILKGRVSEEALTSEYWYAGHNIWIYMLYAAGVPGVLWLFGVFCLPTPITIAIAQGKYGLMSAFDAAQVASIAGVFWVYLVYSLTGGPFSERLGGALMGITIAFLFQIGARRPQAVLQ